MSSFSGTCPTGGTLHVMGLLSPGGVHSHQDHIFGLIRCAKAAGITKIAVHVFTDGRDVQPKSCLESIESLKIVCAETGAHIASISGRFYAMDRNDNLDRTQAAYQAIRHTNAPRIFSIDAAIEAAYQQGTTDEYIPPTVIQNEQQQASPIISGDGVIFANFRTDRPRQLTEAFLAEGLEDISFTTMTRYSEAYPLPAAYEKTAVRNTLGEVLEQHQITQLRTTEKEKFPHVTFFMNGQSESIFKGEDRVFIPSNIVREHAQMPKMKAAEISATIIQAMVGKTHQVIIGNICNGDMVGHSGDVDATKKAVLAVDAALNDIIAAAKANHYALIITADHGNCDEMIGKNGEVLTEHSTNPVPFFVILPGEEFEDFMLAGQQPDYKLADIAPTVLALLGIAQPSEMTGRSLVTNQPNK